MAFCQMLSDKWTMFKKFSHPLKIFNGSYGIALVGVQFLDNDSHTYTVLFDERNDRIETT